MSGGQFYIARRAQARWVDRARVVCPVCEKDQEVHHRTVLAFQHQDEVYDYCEKCGYEIVVVKPNEPNPKTA